MGEGHSASCCAGWTWRHRRRAQKKPRTTPGPGLQATAWRAIRPCPPAVAHHHLAGPVRALFHPHRQQVTIVDPEIVPDVLRDGYAAAHTDVEIPVVKRPVERHRSSRSLQNERGARGALRSFPSSIYAEGARSQPRRPPTRGRRGVLSAGNISPPGGAGGSVRRTLTGRGRGRIRNGPCTQNAIDRGRKRL